MMQTTLLALAIAGTFIAASAMRLTDDADFEYQNTPWPDGSKILFTQWVDANYNDLYVVTTDGSGEKTKLNPQDHTYNHPDVDPNGKLICYATGEDNTKTWEVTLLNIDDGSEVKLTDNESIGLDSQYPRFNGAGEKIAYVQRNNDELFDSIVVMDLDGANPVTVAKLPAGRDEVVNSMDWLGDKDEIVYTTLGGYFYKVAAGPTAPTIATSPVRLGDEKEVYIRAQSSPDGSKIVMSVGPDRQHIHYRMMNADGTDERVIVDTNNEAFAEFRGVYCQVCWTADGSGIIAVADLPDAPDYWDLFVIKNEELLGE